MEMYVYIYIYIDNYFVSYTLRENFSKDLIFFLLPGLGSVLSFYSGHTFIAD